MQKRTDGARRVIARARADRFRQARAARFHERSIRAARRFRAALLRRPSPSLRSAGSALGAALRQLATAERALPISVAAIVAVASMLAFLPGGRQGAVGGTGGRGTDVRLTIGGAVPDPYAGMMGVDGPTVAARVDPAAGEADRVFQPLDLPGDIATEPNAEVDATTAVRGAFLDDGTLLTGYAPETTVEDGSDLIRRYKVRSGDTLVGIARKYGVSMMTLWWANDLDSKDELHVGQVLKIPPVSGLVVTVKASDTIGSIAEEYSVKASRILELNGLDDPNLVVGQTLVLPGAKGEPIPTPKPTPKPKPKPSVSRSGGGSVRAPTHYSGGRFRWPVVGGGNYISQYYHYGHYAIDIAADYGSTVVAAAGGRVQFAGWKSNGGGYQVWIAHGGGLYTTYNHMSSVSVGTGQYVGRGQRVGRVGASGWATGPHLHFEVWVGPIWNGGSRVNPMRYF